MAEIFSELFSLGITRLSKDLGYIGLLHIRLALKFFKTGIITYLRLSMSIFSKKIEPGNNPRLFLL